MIFKIVVFFQLSYFINIINSQYITTIAGNGMSVYNGDNIPAINAELEPYAIFVDNNGNIYVSDVGSNRVRRIDSLTKIITTIAGNGNQGFSGDGVLAINTALNGPNGIFIDNNENLYIADSLNNRIRFINSATQLISTIAGTGEKGFSSDNVLAFNSELNYPTDVFVDIYGNIYICDNENQRIRKVNSSGFITTIAGIGTPGYNGDGILATIAKIFDPYGIFVDLNENIYFCDLGTDRIRYINSTNQIITTIAGGVNGYNGDNMLAINSYLYNPSSLFVDLWGNVFICDENNNRIRFINSSTGIITTIAGNGNQGFSGDNSLAINAELYFPFGVFVDKFGNIYVADWQNNRIRLISNISSITGSSTTESSTTGLTSIISTSFQISTTGFLIQENQLSNSVLSIIIIIPILLIIAFIIIIFIYYKKKQRLANNSKNQLESHESITIINSEQMESMNINNEKLEIKNIIIQETIGEGNFGFVLKALLNNSTLVALKQLKDLSRKDELLKEAQILQKLKHPNIIHYFGIYYKDENPLLVMEFMDKGNLLDLLQTKKDYLTLNDLKKMVIDTLNGMIYLEDENIIHRDLAARNLLVCRSEKDKFIIKISDFGFGKIMENNTKYYGTSGQIPVKWSSPEVLGSLKFTSKSDVWSFGVVLWEIYTFGNDPYSELPTAFKIIEMIQQGYTLNPPEIAPNDVKLIMKDCWKMELNDRPSFSQIKKYQFFQQNDDQIISKQIKEIYI